MAITSKLSDPEKVSLHIQKLDADMGQIVEYLRNVILGTDESISEHIKWNNPSFYYNGEMKDFDPKEYKRDLIVMNLFKGRVMLVFPSGNKINDHKELLHGDYKDGRRTVVFTDLEDVKSKEKLLQGAILEWVKLVDK